MIFIPKSFCSLGTEIKLIEVNKKSSNPDSLPVNTFGINGKLILDNTYSFITEIKITASGDIICMLYNATEKYLMKVLSNGTIDNTFGVNSKYILGTMPNNYLSFKLDIDNSNRIFFYLMRCAQHVFQIALNFLDFR